MIVRSNSGGRERRVVGVRVGGTVADDCGELMLR